MDTETIEKLIYPPSVLAPDNYSYREPALRAPVVEVDDEIIFDEPGRVLGRVDSDKPGDGVCCRSHYFRVTKRMGFYHLLVRHGGGSEQWRLDYDKRTIRALAALDSDSRFRLLWVIMAAHQDGEREGATRMDGIWRRAAADKRIKTRKTKAGINVWIDPDTTP